MASQKFFIFSFLVALVSGGSQIDFDNDKSQNGVRSHFVTKGLIKIPNPQEYIPSIASSWCKTA